MKLGHIFVVYMLITCSITIHALPFISLGQDCQITYQLRNFDMRDIAFPFDWLRSYNFEKVCLAIQEEFAYFLHPNCLELTKIDKIIYNTRYDLQFVHDFPTIQTPHVSQENENCGTVVPNFLDFVGAVEEKFKRRIERFLEYLHADDPVVFLRTHISPSQAQHFVTMITSRYPQLPFMLLVIHENKAHNYPWNIAHTQQFYAEKKDLSNSNNWFDASEWHKVFEVAKEYITNSHFKP